MARIRSITARDSAGQKLDGYSIDLTKPPPGPALDIPRTIGLGDLVARFAQPIAVAIDTITERMLPDDLRTELEKCPACGRRHRKLNLLCPDVLTCPFLAHLLKLLPGPARDALLAAAAAYAKPA